MNTESEMETMPVPDHIKTQAQFYVNLRDGYYGRARLMTLLAAIGMVIVTVISVAAWVLSGGGLLSVAVGSIILLLVLAGNSLAAAIYDIAEIRVRNDLAKTIAQNPK